LPPDVRFLKCIKSFVGWSSAPDQAGGAYSAPPDPLLDFRGLLLRKLREGEEYGRGWDPLLSRYTPACTF